MLHCMNIHTPALPPGLAAAVSSRQWEYIDPNTATLLHSVWLGAHTHAGVIGNRERGSYEWFLWDSHTLTASNVGYGHAACALAKVFARRDVKALLS